MPALETPSDRPVFRFLCLGSVLLILVAISLTTITITTAQHPPRTASPPVEEFVMTRDRTLFVRCEGAGAPLIFLESGLGGQSKDWAAIQGELARSTTVCAYDRAGEGRSDPTGDTPHDAADVAGDLDVIIQAIGIDEPIVLAGFSFGGLLARYYASTRPDSVAALALIDSTPPVWTMMNLSGANLETRIGSLLSFSGISENAPERLDLLKASEQVFMVGAPRVPVFMISSGVKSQDPGPGGDARQFLAIRLQHDQAVELDAQHTVVAGCPHAMPIACPDDVIQVLRRAIDHVRGQPDRESGNLHIGFAVNRGESRRTTIRRRE